MGYAVADRVAESVHAISATAAKAIPERSMGQRRRNVSDMGGKMTRQPNQLRPKPPQTPREWALYRCKASCDVGLRTLDGALSPPPQSTAAEYALYSLLRAVEDLATAMQEGGE